MAENNNFSNSTIHKIVISWDFALGILVAVLFFGIGPEEINYKISNEIFSVVISTLSIIFSVFFAALAVLISSGDDAFIIFLEDVGLYKEIIWYFRYTLFILFFVLLISIFLFVTTLFQADLIQPGIYPKYLIGVYLGLVGYALFCSINSAIDSIKYAQARSKFLQIKRKLKTETNKDPTQSLENKDKKTTSSPLIKMQTTPPVLTQTKTSETILSRYESLVRSTSNIIRPPSQNQFFDPNYSKWSKIKRFLYNYSNPFEWLVRSSGLFSFFYLLLYFSIIILWLLVGTNILLLEINNIPYKLFDTSQPLSIEKLFPILVLGLGMLFTPSPYIYWANFIARKRYRLAVRITFTAIIIALSLFYVLWIRFDYCFSSFSSPLLTTQLTRIVIIIIFTIIPGLVSGLLLAFDICATLIEKSKSLLRYLVTYHTSPLFTKFIIELQRTPISSPPWKMTDLSCFELSNLKMIAQTNLDSIEKRITPTLVVFALIGLVINIQPFIQFINNLVSFSGGWWLIATSNKYSLMMFLEFFASFIILFTATAFVFLMCKLLSNMFNDIFAQSIIIEACIASEYEKAISQQNSNQEKHSNFLKRIFKHLVQ